MKCKVPLCQKSFLEQVSHFFQTEISHLGVKHFLHVFLAEMSLVPQSYIINYALDLNQDK